MSIAANKKKIHAIEGVARITDQCRRIRQDPIEDNPTAIPKKEEEIRTAWVRISSRRHK